MISFEGAEPPPSVAAAAEPPPPASAAPAGDERKLPRAWERHTDPNGKVWYWNKFSDEVRNEFPADLCGSNGCILLDRHKGLCQIPTND